VSGETRVVTTRAGLRAANDALPQGARRAVVLTMGALHDGHAELIRHARSLVGAGGQVTVTVFVNPSQFNDVDDLARYPRTLEADVELCARESADVVFAPTVDVVYREGARDGVTVDPGPFGTVLEGAVRPGHFRGVLTVVHKLLCLTDPHLALFGEKDYQQLTLVRRMVRDLDLDVDIVGVPTVRAADGLALSSRNARLSDVERHRAGVVPQALEAGGTAARRGGSAVEVARAAQALFDESGVATDYVVVTDPDLGPFPESGDARLLVAATIGTTRLIDNARLALGATT
jgi:pantoate--beta-alanine ligase